MKISTYITQTLYDNHLISQEYKPVYIYCLDMFFEYLFVFLTLFIFAIASRRIFLTIIFLIAVIPLRSFGGGIHVKSPTLCLILSIAMYFSIMGLCEFTPIYPNIGSQLLLIVSLFFSVIIAPVEAPNKPLSKTKCKQLKFALILSNIFIFFIGCMLYHNNSYKAYSVLVYTILIVVIGQVIGKINHSVKKN